MTHVPQKMFKLTADQIGPLATGQGSCIATDRITVDGAQVGYCYREVADSPPDSGWRFFAGDESETYLDDPDNMAIYDVNTIANYDPDIIQILEAPFGSAYERGSHGKFILINEDDPQGES